MHTARSRTFARLGLVALLATGVASAGTFPDFGYQPPSSEYSGPLFQLSQNYPQTLPSGKPAFFTLLPSKLTNNYDSWKPYLAAVKQYCLAGNAETNWDVQKNPVRHWYHMPWQHYGALGREGIHGLTKEAPIQPKQLASTQTDSGQTYAVGVYNAIGAYTIGEVWKNPQKPDASYTSEPNSFHDGTVVCKALFADIDYKNVPFLQNPVLWQAYVTNTFDSADRSVKKLALIQMDFAVRDSRVPGTGWLFGTFQYNGAVSGKPSWENLVPLGVMWGNDPELTGSEYDNPTPTETRINPNIKEAAINPGKELPPTHLGWNGRVDGPVDNPLSSCMSCHMTAEYPQLSPMNPTFQEKSKIPPVGSKEWMRWFQNEEAGVPFDKGAQSTDYSLQLAGAMANFYDWKCNQGGVFVDGGNACQKAAKLKKTMLRGPAPHQRVFKVERAPAAGELK
ncbi:hypothetical protein [Oleiagrimonas soli]|uniref:Cytochrome c domain-containing protein n=1 Tax=Oleiagrimonas soli TaxID=1543381 RepID=A0A099CWC0_9GAMM|nr:hypothetical protein [Oleiagrimonas soli]KGI77937.1 hypothetical protein LF63_0105965 [Oleiagrimonas soli]MBB6183691.1 hypothetical protein [Oleiagrimonas soli]